MKNFSELLATKLELTVVVNGVDANCGLHDYLIFKADDSVTIDGIEILPKYWHLTVDNHLKITEPFYCWYHRISDQGWLLAPQ
jgi:hypothetical protein